MRKPASSLPAWVPSVMSCNPKYKTNTSPSQLKLVSATAALIKVEQDPKKIKIILNSEQQILNSLRGIS